MFADMTRSFQLPPPPPASIVRPTPMRPVSNTKTTSLFRALVATAVDVLALEDAQLRIDWVNVVVVTD